MKFELETEKNLQAKFDMKKIQFGKMKQFLNKRSFKKICMILFSK